MPVSQDTVRRVQRSWVTISNYASTIGDEFYKELFRQYPAYQPYFRTDREIQIDKLSRMLNILINGMDVWDDIEPEIRKLGSRHARYGDFNEQDYQNVMLALITVINKFRQEQSEEITEAWYAVFNQVADTMLLGAAEASAANS